jgi:murein L,D-transpeptidase YcbB/YkuD
MKSISFTLITLVAIGLLGTGGYFALRGLTKPSDYIPTTVTRVGDLHKLETDPQSGTTQAGPVPTSVAVTKADSNPEPKEDPVPRSTKKSLVDNIQSLISAKVTLKVGSKGPNVGYVQQFMNVYFKKTLKIDNDFGKTLETNVKLFQKAVGVSQTGQIGTQTLTKMVEWLGKNPQ